MRAPARQTRKYHPAENAPRLPHAPSLRANSPNPATAVTSRRPCVLDAIAGPTVTEGDPEAAIVGVTEGDPAAAASTDPAISTAAATARADLSSGPPAQRNSLK